jgi:hypothetical protein
MKPTRPEDLFRAEKERARSSSTSQHARLLAEAKAAFDKLMAEGQAARKSGRPRKHPLPPLKTSSSRTPPRPPTPLLAGKPTPPVALLPAATPPAPVAAPKPPKVAAKPPKQVAKSAKPARKAAKPAKSKGKAARSKKR